MTTGTGSYFERVDERRFRATELTSGAWNTAEQHVAPMFGLIAHEIELHAKARGRDADLIPARLSFDILGVLAIDEFSLDVEVVRPGRTVELVEATVTMHGRAAVRARVWRLARFDTNAVAGGAPDALPHADSIAPWDMPDVWPGAFIGTLDVRPVYGPTPGRTTAWVSSDVDVVANEAVGPLATFLRFVDTANGIAVRQPPTEWVYPNLDLAVHLFRQPTGTWTGLDTTVVFGSDGVGLTSTVLHDVDGPVGRAEQSLTVRRA